MSEEVKQFWNERFGREEYIYGTAPNTFLEQSVHTFPSGGNVLCIAEGEGRNALFLGKQGHQVHAVDLSIEGKAKAERLAQENGVSLQYTICDLNDFEYGENRWDAIVSIFAHVDSASRANIYPKAIASLKEGGVFLLESYHPKQLEYGTGGPKDVNMLVTLEDLRPLFPGMTIVHEAELERDVTEGSFHTGNAYVTQWIAQKN
ncbi:class I SAM-dependent methyltransferase [Bremerella sp. JC770]|uniref:SAM-dependent methyltransferase n=1 Tax=Bremerella sp. JC770 TaxID=3232137 RepID=UPI003458ADE7